MAVLISVGALTLAISPSAHAEECGKVTYADGTVGPSVCPDGSPNSAVTSAYRTYAPAVMALKENTKKARLKDAVKADCRAGVSKPAVYDAIEYQTARFGWSRATVNPVVKYLINTEAC